MPDVMHPVGRARDGRIVHVRDAQRGLASGISCLTCHQAFIAVQGPLIAWHFRHYSENPACHGSVMSDAHDYAQDILLNASQITLPALPGKRPQVTDYTNPARESRQPGYMLDVLAQVRGRPFGIEVRYTNAVPAAKRALIQAANMPVIEINIAEAARRLVYTPDSFARYVLHEAPRIWLHISHYVDQQSLDARMRHADELRKWHRREPPYDAQLVSVPALDPEAGQWTRVVATE